MKKIRQHPEHYHFAEAKRFSFLMNYEDTIDKLTSLVEEIQVYQSLTGKANLVKASKPVPEKVVENTVTQSPYEMIEMEDAFSIADEAARSFGNNFIEMKSLSDAYGYTLGEDIVSEVNIPPYRASIMDGYAFKKEEYETIQEFVLIESRSLAGCQDKDIKEMEINEGQIMYVTTGSPVHSSFDIVIPIEHVLSKIPEDLSNKDLLKIKTKDESKPLYMLRQPVNNDWIREVGCDIAIGQVVLPKKTQIGCSEVGILASIGVTEDIPVFKKPKIGIAASGNEIVEAGSKNVHDGDGKIRDSNTPMLISILKSHGFDDIK